MPTSSVLLSCKPYITCLLGCVGSGSICELWITCAMIFDVLYQVVHKTVSWVFESVYHLLVFWANTNPKLYMKSGVGPISED